MQATSNTWFQECIAALNAPGDLRVWSLVVTLFGDLARAPGDTISGPLMTRIIEPIGIRPEALRVALHRLRNDGWIASERKGRSSEYHLTEYGRRQSEAASPRIYAQEPPKIDSWHLLVLEPMTTGERSASEKTHHARGYVSIAPGVLLGRGGAGPENNAFVLEGGRVQVPDWLRAQIGPEEINDAYKALETALDRVDVLLGPVPSPSSLQIATLRTLIVHNWRRVLLSHPDLPPVFFPEDWHGFQCRSKVNALLLRLPRPTPAEIAAA
ncbi:transcriptional regulator, PaaX family [Salinihabitans flavidus]|uniref:Transcriptional regulator, PaaX family n=1 Tax=Salinihabitans flavidus TaxID=569882 RepID=A0A1H8LJP5_9RHOB|nr:PaaX family transcriptional regulator C-terminal domain-containing protein [Salinihabitans flavidus]SEO04978.1 transcriptional regulator, PaaX family [Salinihabitans flavidus]